MSERSLAGRTAFVTGTGANIGVAIACELAANGARVACYDRDPQAARRAADAIATGGGQALAITGDVTDANDVAEAVRLAEERFGIIDLLINNAAFRMRGGTLDVELGTWTRTLATVLDGTLLCSRTVARRLIDEGRPGAIVNIASSAGHRAQNDAVAYCTAKGGLLNLTRAMALDLAPHRIRVTSVSPTRTGSGVQQSGRRHPLRDDIPLGRLGEAQDVADAVIFLLSDAASFITGTDLCVDGGSLATWGPRLG